MPNDSKAPLPTTQSRSTWRKQLPEWMQQLPSLSFPRLNDNYNLIKAEELEKLFQANGISEAVSQHFIEEIKLLDHEAMRLFRERDHDASEHQNRYRLYQMGYMGLATAATFLGSLQAVAFGSDPSWVPLFALLQALVAGFSTFLATITGNASPLPDWMDNRRKAEFMRREYFRYFMNLFPYRLLDEDGKPIPRYERIRTLAGRIADANDGKYPDEMYMEQ